jgi:SAM-dependent methyltransferase
MNFQNIKSWLRGEIVDKSLTETIPQLSEWFEQPCGRVLLESEQLVVSDLLPSLFGYHLMQMSVSEKVELLQNSPIHHRINVYTRSNACQPQQSMSADKKAYLVSDFDQLPIESDSIDVVVLHHVLDFSPHPHQVLKEVNRILIPRGHVIIIGFNPFSLFGMCKFFASLFSKNSHWRYSSIAKRRLFDWFKLLDLEKTKVAHTFFRPPFNSAMLLKRFSFLEKTGARLGIPFGGVYVVLARKDVGAVTPIKAPWEKTNRRLMGLTATRPSSPRSYRDHRKNKHDLH